MKKARYAYSIHAIFNEDARAIMLALSSKIERWQHTNKPSDPEQYISRIISSGSTDYVRIVLITYKNRVVGSCFIGLISGYDREKTKAEMAYCKRDSSFLDQPTVWLNYVTWEAKQNDLTALPTNDLVEIWQCAANACREIFPEAIQIVVRVRHYEIWSEAHPSPPWEIVAELDLRGFEWTAPDGQHFTDYDDRFRQAGVLRLLL